MALPQEAGALGTCYTFRRAREKEENREGEDTAVPHHPLPYHLPRRRARGRAAGARWVLSVGRLWVCCLWVLLATPQNTCADSNGCDFFGSGLEQDGRGVQPVYLSCAAGRVEWQYPRAGLRVILKAPHRDREFRGCIKGDAAFSGARVFLEGHRSLLPLLAPDDGSPQELVRCFNSHRGQAALYVEAEAGGHDLSKQVAAFDYDLQTLPKGVLYDSHEECRPCSEEELLHLYCAGDFVALGSIVGVTDDTRLSTTSVTLRASRILQQTAPVFRLPRAHRDREGEDLIGGNGLEGEGYIGRVEVPLHCGARHGSGEFLVMGVMRLGHPILRCAPRREEWRSVARAAKGKAQCILET